MKKQPTHCSGMGLKPKIMMKVVGQHQRIDIRRSLNYGEVDKGGGPFDKLRDRVRFGQRGRAKRRALFPAGRGLGDGRKEKRNHLENTTHPAQWDELEGKNAGGDEAATL